MQQVNQWHFSIAFCIAQNKAYPDGNKKGHHQMPLSFF